jgi:RNA polymerase sigma factor (sigma-70 family)
MTSAMPLIAARKRTSRDFRVVPGTDLLFVLYFMRLSPKKCQTHGNLFAFPASNPSVVQRYRLQRNLRAQEPQIAPAGTSDTELVRRARGRDEAAIRLILRANNRRLYRIARGILRDESEAEDVVQETYVRAFTQLDVFRGDSSLATWLARIAMNEALGRLRRRRPGVEWSSLPPGALEAQVIQFPHSAASEDPEKSMAQRQIQHVVEHAIDELHDDGTDFFSTMRFPLPASAANA